MEKAEEGNKQQGITQKDTEGRKTRKKDLSRTSAANPCSIKVYKGN